MVTSPSPASAPVDFGRRPMLVFWETTRSCPLSCRHCRASATLEGLPGELDTSQARSLIDQVADFGTPHPVLVMTGGDCLMRQDLFELIDYAVSREVPVALSPAVSPLLTPDAIRRIAASGVRAVSISLDGASTSTHDGVRGVPGHFGATLTAIERLSDAGLRVQVNTTVMRANVEELPDVFALLPDVGAHIWEVFFLVHVGRGSATGAISAAEHEDVCHFLVDASGYGVVVRTVEAPFFRRVQLQRKTGDAPPSPLYGRLSARLQQVAGPPTRSSATRSAGTRDGNGIIFVDYAGTVYPAGFLPTPLDNVGTHSLSDIYTDHPLLRDIRAARFVGRCGSCPYAQLCGGSRARAFAHSGDPLGEDPACAYQPPALGVPA